ncbi:hypothetical protein HanRHA438_Chr04g0170021 [Helianthus annuus]|nr:hypothetical protein HanRHA438_Chr04g0170021 [Helianthus annuus]
MFNVRPTCQVCDPYWSVWSIDKCVVMLCKVAHCALCVCMLRVYDKSIYPNHIFVNFITTILNTNPKSLPVTVNKSSGTLLIKYKSSKL